jgi:hypothetical protein
MSNRVNLSSFEGGEDLSPFCTALIPPARWC